MSNVQTQIDRIISAVDAAHAKVAEKGGTTARPYLVGTLADAIGTIPTGVELPTLTNEGAAADLLTGKQLIDGDGNVVKGTMPNNGAMNKTMDGIEVKSVAVPAGYTSGGTVALDGTIDGIADDQASLISQIQTALEGKAAGGGGDSGVPEPCAVYVSGLGVPDVVVYKEYITAENTYWVCVTSGLGAIVDPDVVKGQMVMLVYEASMGDGVIIPTTSDDVEFLSVGTDAVLFVPHGDSCEIELHRAVSTD